MIFTSRPLCRLLPLLSAWLAVGARCAPRPASTAPAARPELVEPAARGLAQGVLWSRDGRTLVLGHGYLISDFPLTESALQRGEPACVSLLDPQADPGEAALLAELKLDSLLMLPLPGPAGPWGLAEMYVNGRRFDEDDVARVRPVAAAFGERLAALPAPASAR